MYTRDGMTYKSVAYPVMPGILTSTLATRKHPATLFQTALLWKKVGCIQEETH